MPGHASSNANVPDMLPATSRLDDHAVSRTSSLPPLITRLDSPRRSRTPPATVPLTAMAVGPNENVPTTSLPVCDRSSVKKCTFLLFKRITPQPTHPVTTVEGSEAVSD